MKFNLSLLLHTSKSHTKHGGQKSDFVNPARDWGAGLMIAALTFCCGVGYLVFDFNAQFGAASDSIVIESQPVIYRDKEVQSYAELYFEKERMFNDLRRQRQVVVPVQMNQLPETEVENSENNPLAEIELAQ